MEHRDRDRYTTRTVNMNELLHIILSLQIMFGSRRALVAIGLILLLGGAGYFVVQYYSDPMRGVGAADRLWDEDKNVEAVRQYKDLLNKRDPINPEYALVPREDRIRLYRRIITHEAVYGSRQDARDWITRAFQEGINFEQADFEHEDVFNLWMEVIEPLRPNGSKQRDLIDESLKIGQ
jgi:hypothetical protein